MINRVLLFGLLQLARPANVITSIADVVAGYAIVASLAGIYIPNIDIIFLIIATSCLYAGGVVYNDVFDAKLDAVERPERPIPKGTVSLLQAQIWGAILLTIGVLAGYMVNVIAGAIATLICIFALLYDKYSKHHIVFGPLNMGLCRGLNLCLGMAFIPSNLYNMYLIAIIPIIYTAAITLTSHGEVHNGGTRNLYIAAALLCLVYACQTYIFVTYGTRSTDIRLYFQIFMLALPFSVLYHICVAIVRKAAPTYVMHAVKMAVINIIFIDVSWAACFGQYNFAFFMISLFFISRWLARIFAVT
ncbi:MAG: UbiA-like protein EboC [Cytophagales bacterium]|nr:UbiA-like protein EboC [Cytophagales bacterium]